MNMWNLWQVGTSWNQKRNLIKPEILIYFMMRVICGELRLEIFVLTAEFFEVILNKKDVAPTKQ